LPINDRFKAGSGFQVRKLLVQIDTEFGQWTHGVFLRA
jgi:hypothetical protein